MIHAKNTIKSKLVLHIFSVFVVYFIVVVFISALTNPYIKFVDKSIIETQTFNQLYFPFLFTFITFFALIFTFSKTEFLKIKSIHIYRNQFSYTFFIVPIIVYIIILLVGVTQNIIYLQIFLIVQLITTFIQTIFVFYKYNDNQYISNQLSLLSSQRCWDIIKLVNVENYNHKRILEDFINNMEEEFILSLDCIENFNIDPKIQEILIYQLAKANNNENIKIKLLNNNVKIKNHEIIANCLNEAINRADHQVFYNLSNAISNNIEHVASIVDTVNSNLDIITVFEKVDYEINLEFLCKATLNYIQFRGKELNDDVFQQIFLTNIFDTCMKKENGKEMFLSIILHNYVTESKNYIDSNSENENAKPSTLKFIKYQDTYIGLYSPYDIKNINKYVDKKIEEYQLIKELNLSDTDFLYQLFIRNINNTQYYSEQFLEIKSEETKRPIVYNEKSNNFIEYIDAKNKEILNKVSSIKEFDKTSYQWFVNPKELPARMINGKLEHGYFFNDSYYMENGFLKSIQEDRNSFIKKAIELYSEFIIGLKNLKEMENIQIDDYFQIRSARAIKILNNSTKIINDNIGNYTNIDRKQYSLDKALRDSIPLYNEKSMIALIMLEGIINKDKMYSYATNYELTNYLYISKILKYGCWNKLINNTDIKHYSFIEYLRFVEKYEFKIYYEIFMIKYNIFNSTNSITGLKENTFIEPFFTFKYYENITEANFIKLIEISAKNDTNSKQIILDLLEGNRDLKYILLKIKLKRKNRLFNKIRKL